MDINFINKDNISPEYELFLQEPVEVQSVINNYMTKKCTLNLNEQTFDHTAQCENYHNESQRRRKPFRNGRLLYRSEICMFNSNFCKKYEECDKCHNNFEYCFHPEKFRTSSCNLVNCRKFGKICPFSHSVDTLRNSYSYTNNNLNIINNKYNYNFSNPTGPQLNLEIAPIKAQNTTAPDENINRINENIFQNGLKETDLAYFKVYPCNIYSKHNEKQCIFYHSAKDFKRMLTKITYSFELCKFAEAGRSCPNGEFCLKSHNRVEQFYHPDKFKSKFCSHYNNLTNCPYGKFCSFAHSEAETKVDLIHKYEQNEDFFIFYFKTVWCPYNHVHDKSSCVYAHNWQDYRRSPVNYTYSDNICTFWDNKKTILNYNEGCGKEYRCENCHGWKEQDYHPLVYKTKKCKYLLAFCNKGIFCPFFHKEENQRIVNEAEKEMMKKKIEKKVPLNIYVNSIYNLQTEFMNKSDLIVGQRNSIMSLDFKPFTNNSFNQNNERRSIFDNSTSQLLINEQTTNQNNYVNSTVNNSTMNTEAKINNNMSYSNILNERSNSIFSTGSSKSIKINSQINPRVSVIAKATKRLSNFTKEKLNHMARFSLLLPEHNPDYKLEDIEDKGSSEMNSDNSIIEGDGDLDSSGEFSKIMKKDEKGTNSKKNSVFSKNFKPFDPRGSILQLDSLSLVDIQRLREVLKDEPYNEQNSNIIIKEAGDEFSFDGSKYREQMLDYLKINGFKILHNKIFEKVISPKELVSWEDEKIGELVEEENKQRIPNLKRFITDLDDAHDYDDLVKKIDNDILNGESSPERKESLEN